MKLKKACNFLDKALNAISTVAMALIFLVVFFNVVLRYLFKSGFAWSEELARMLFVMGCLLGMVTATRDRKHFSVTMFTNMMPRGVKLVLEVLVNIICIVLAAFMLFGAVDMSKILSNTITPALHMPASTNYYVMIFACAIMIFYLIINTVEDILRFISKEDIKQIEAAKAETEQMKEENA